MRIAITGGIGSGKSYVCRILQQHYGVEVFNCDIVAKYIIATHPEVRQALTNLVAEEQGSTAGEKERAADKSVLTADKPMLTADRHTPAVHKPTLAEDKPVLAEDKPVLTKKALGNYIRRSPDNAARVNAIVHPRVAEAFELYCQQPAPAPQQPGGALPAPSISAEQHHWMECAILFESGFDRLVDLVVVVTCPTEERIRRITERDNCDESTARRWLTLQMTDEERLSRPHYRIINDGTTPILPQLEALLASLPL